METTMRNNTRNLEQQLRQAETGLIRLLHAKHFPRDWIERHTAEAMAQARTDFAVRHAAGKEDDTVNLLVVIGYRRALKILRSEKNRPPTSSLESVFHLADKSAPTPEEVVIDQDRRSHVLEALRKLPTRERALLLLVYVENMSIRAAGRRLGWEKSAANRHHTAAVDRLRPLLNRGLSSM